MLGIDVSNNNGRVDWRRAASDGVCFGWCKATEGRTFDDEQFEQNRREAAKHGVKVGAYHYARPDNNSAVAEAAHFLAVARPRPDELLPVLDFEKTADLSPAVVCAWALEFLRIVEREIGAKPIFYSYPYFITGTMGGAAGLEAYPLWLASYGPNDGRNHGFRIVGGWDDAAVHQYTSRGRIAGVAQDCDVNRLVGATLEDLVYRKPTRKPRASARPPLPAEAWMWARWYLGVGEYDVRRDPHSRPGGVPMRVPESWWGAVRWCLDNGDTPALPALDEGDQDAAALPAGTKPKKQRVIRASAWLRREAIRRRMVSTALEIAKWPELGHYAQTRPIPTLVDRYTLDDLLGGDEWWGDCSGTYKWIAKLAGAPDPDGLGAWGNTTTFARYMRRVSMPALGDAVLYDGHVVMITGFEYEEPTRDLSKIGVFSHGSEAGPYGYPEGELTADYRLRTHGRDDFLGFYRIVGL